MKDAETMDERIRQLRDMKEHFRQGGGPGAIERQHSRGKLTIRERLDILLDPGTFVELDLLVSSPTKDFGMDEVETPGDACVAGWGRINGRKVWVYGHDFTVMGGSWGQMSTAKFMKTQDKAMEMGTPLVLLYDSGGRRPQEQQEGLRVRGLNFFKHVWASGVIPQITMVMGPVAGGPCYGPALTDFILMVKNTSYMFIGGPPVVKAVTGEDVTLEQLGGSEIHTSVSGVADLALKDDEECLLKSKELLAFLPSNNRENPPFIDTGDDPNRMDEELNHILPEEKEKGYDMHLIIERVVDNGYFFELKPNFAKNLMIGFARLAGHTVGIVASQPLWMGGALDSDAADKGARFIRFCDAFNIPILNVLDSPGYLVGTKMEQAGIIRHGAKMLYAQSETTVPKITLIVRKAGGGAHSGMGAPGSAADLTFAWPTAEVGQFGVDAAMSVLTRTRTLKERLAKAEDPDALIEQWKKEYYDKNLNIYNVLPLRHADDIIEPKETRPLLIKALDTLRDKKVERPWKKHGNIPL